MRGVATDIGMPPMSLYRYYRNRDALIDALVERGLGEFEDALRSVSNAGAPLQRLRRLTRAYLEFALEHSATYDLLFRTTRASPDPFIDDYKVGASPSFEILRAQVAAAMGAGEITARNSVEVALTLWAHAHGTISLYLAGRYGRGEPLFRRFYARSMEIVLDGLRGR